MLKRACFLLIIAGITPAGIARAERSSNTYVVLPFERTDGASRREYAPAMTALLAESLQCSRNLMVIHGPSLVVDVARFGISSPLDSSGLAIAASATGARWVFAGSYEGTDENLQMTLRLYDAVDDVIKSEAIRSGSRDDIVAMLRSMQSEVLTVSDLRSADTPDCGTAMTDDPYALILFGRAIRDANGLDGRPTDSESAVAWLEKTVNVDPQFVSARRYLGYVQELAGRQKTARRHYALALEARPEDLWALYGLASVEYALGRFADSEEYAAKALRILPASADLHFLRGRSLWRLDREQDAEVELLTAIATRPDHLEARRTLAEIYANRGATAELVSTLEAIAKMDSRDITARFHLAAAYMRAGEIAKAMAVYERVVVDRPDRVSAYKFLGDLHRRRGEFDRAIAAYAAGQHRAPWDPRFIASIAGALHAKGDHLGAIKAFNALAEKHPGYKRLADRNSAVLTWHLGRRDVASGMIEKLAGAKPEPADMHLRAIVRYGRGRVLEAKADAVAATEADPAEAAYATTLKLIEAAVSDKDEAVVLTPTLDEPFWNVERYKLSVDRYFRAATEFSAVRDNHDRAYIAIIASLSERRAMGKKGCPTAEIASSFAANRQALATMGQLHKELAWRHDAVLRHHRWGETDGLLAEYAGKLQRVHGILIRIEREQRETGSAFSRSLTAELAAAGCKVETLLAANAGASVEQTADARAGRVRTYPNRPVTPINNGSETIVGDDLASVTVFFVIDNRDCERSQRVVVDGRELGNVAKKIRATFEVRGGRHAVCVTPSADPDACAAPTANRQSYIHEGWTLTLHCD